MSIFVTTPAQTRNRSRAARLRLCIATLALASAGCTSSPAVHFYTLNAEIPSADTNPTPLPATSKKRDALLAQPDAKFYIEVSAVQIPAQVDRPQFVITTLPSQLEIKEQQRWAAPLRDEIRQLLSDTLMHQLATFDVGQTPVATSAKPIYRVSLKVQRFTSILTPSSRSTTSSATALHALWSVRLLATDAAPTLVCQSFASEAVKPSYPALVLGHRHAIQRIAQDIAATIQALATAATPEAARAISCPVVRRAGATQPKDR